MREIEKRTGLTLGAGEATCREGNGTGWESLACLNVICVLRFIGVLWPYIGEGNGTPLQYSCLENPTDCTIHGVAKSRTQLSDFTFSFHFHALEKEMATHSRVLAWRIPETGEPGGLPSMGSHRVGHV